MQNLQTNCTSGAFTLLPKYVLDVIMLLFATTEKSYNGFSMICNKSETKAMCKKNYNLSGAPAKHVLWCVKPLPPPPPPPLTQIQPCLEKI